MTSNTRFASSEIYTDIKNHFIFKIGSHIYQNLNKNTLLFQKIDNYCAFHNNINTIILIFPNFTTIFNYSNVIKTDYFATIAPHTEPIVVKERADEEVKIEV